MRRAAPGKPRLAPAARKALPELPGLTELPHRSALRKAAAGGGDGPAWSQELRAACKLTGPVASTGLTPSWEPGKRHHAVQGCPCVVIQATFTAQPTHHRYPPNNTRKQLPSCDGGSLGCPTESGFRMKRPSSLPTSLPNGCHTLCHILLQRRSTHSQKDTQDSTGNRERG